jgi:hypothetical protein
MDNVNPAKVQIANGLTCEWLHDRNIAVYTFRDVSAETVDHWCMNLAEIATDWSKDQPYLAVYDFSHKDVDYSPNLRHRADQLLDEFLSGVPGRYAVVVTQGMLRRLIRLFTGDDLTGKESIERRFFFDRDESIAWVAEKLGPAADSSATSQVVM